jgi:hypothetical protein
VSAQGFVTWNNPTTTGTTTPVTGTYPGGTVTVSNSGTGTNIVFFNTTQVSGSLLGLNGATATQAFGTAGPQNSASKSLTFTFSSPVTINELNIADIDLVASTWNDNFTFSGITFTSVSGFQCNFSLTGASPTGEFGGNAETARWLTSTSQITSFTINYGLSGGLSHAGLFYSMKVTNPCPAVGTAPTLSATTINNSTCASGYINLNSLVTSTTPTGASLRWFADNTRTTAVIDPTGVTTSGTYYAFYYDATNNCFSSASAAVTATYTVCPLNLTTVCPAVSVDLASRVTDTAPSGYTYTYHSGTPATGSNRLDSSVVSTAGTYYVATYFAGQDCYTNTSRPMVVTITNCCATLAAPTWN